MTFLSLFLKIFSGFKATVVSSFSIVDDIRFNTYTRSKLTIKKNKIRERMESQLIMSKKFFQHLKMEFEGEK